MAKSDLLKEAIADARAVKETALANAKIALQEAFAPRIESMLAAKLSEELEDEELPEDGSMDLDMGSEEEMSADDNMDMGAEEEMSDDMESNDVGDLSIDVNNDGEFDEFDITSREPLANEENPEDLNSEYSDENDDSLELESIIRELEGDMDESYSNDAYSNEEEPSVEEAYDFGNEESDDIDEIIEAILREADDEPMEGDNSKEVAELQTELKQKDEDLQEAYNTVKQLKSIISEVNLLNAKLLYTNKLFRNFDLNESQKMKVLENFDRAGTTREVKLVFSTIAESLKTPTKKRVVKESYASKPTASTKPTATILSEGFEMADRWKKLAGLSK
jgi:hypothetical protein